MSITAPRLGRRDSARSGAPLVGVLALLCVFAAESAAQHPEAAIGTDSLRRIQSVEPLSGPPGTTVRIYSENLPLQARLIVGVGAVRAGFEEIGYARQQEFGEVSATVQLPSSVTWERPVYFILFNGIFSPVGLSEPFHVTTPDGRVRRTGRIERVEGACATLRDEDDVVYGLAGSLGQVRVGEAVVVEGRYSEDDSCGQASTIEVVRVERGGGGT